MTSKEKNNKTSGYLEACLGFSEMYCKDKATNEKIQKVLDYATQKHSGQKYGSSDYIIHPMAVAAYFINIPLQIENQEDHIMTALCHDLLEDTDASETEILELTNSNVLEAVKLLTKKYPYELNEYLEKIKNDPIAYEVKIADRLHNIATLTDADISQDFIDRYLKETRDYYLDFAKASKFFPSKIEETYQYLMIYFNKKNKFIACLLAGAIGDALGYPIEFMDIYAIKAAYGESGLSELPDTSVAVISDDTQMTLFTADGLLWHCTDDKTTCLDAIYKSYIRWYYTQVHRIRNKNWLKKKLHETTDSILDNKELFCRRAPGHTCLSSLGSGEVGTMEESLNNSKGCGGVMRVAPIGLLLHNEPGKAFKLACDAAAITHGHPTGYLAAGTLAAIISEIINGYSLTDSVSRAVCILKTYPRHEETLNAVNSAVKLADSDIASDIAITTLGAGWIAEEALAIALYCALKEPDFRKALFMSVNHSGDSDSTGAICGNILGAIYGLESIPQEWIKNVELNEYVKTVAIRLFARTLPGQKRCRL